MDKKPFGWANNILAVLKKDLLSELRTRYILGTIFMFALTTLVVVSFTMGVLHIDPSIHAALLWIIIFFAAMAGLGRSFVKEEEAGTSLLLRLTVPGEEVYMGKLLFNFIILIVLLFLLAPMYLLLMSPPLEAYAAFALTLLLGVLGIAGTGTILAAIVARSANKGTLLTVLAFPVMLPVIISAVNATKLLFELQSFKVLIWDWVFIFSYNGIIVTASYLLFTFVWEE